MSVKNREPLIHMKMSGNPRDFLASFVSHGLVLNAIDNKGYSAYKFRNQLNRGHT